MSCDRHKPWLLHVTIVSVWLTWGLRRGQQGRHSTEREASSSHCLVFHSLFISQHLSLPISPLHPAFSLCLCLLSVTLHPSINTRSDEGLFFLTPLPVFGEVWEVLMWVHFHTYCSQPSNWLTVIDNRALILFSSVLERSFWHSCLQL